MAIIDNSTITGTCDYGGSDISFEYSVSGNRYTLHTASGNGRSVLSEDGDGARIFTVPRMPVADGIKLYQLLSDALDKEVKPYIKGKL